MSSRCPHCRAPVDYTDAGEMRFDSSQYHMDAAKKLSQLSAWKGYAQDLEIEIERLKHKETVKDNDRRL